MEKKKEKKKKTNLPYQMIQGPGTGYTLVSKGKKKQYYFETKDKGMLALSEIAGLDTLAKRKPSERTNYRNLLSLAKKIFKLKKMPDLPAQKHFPVGAERIAHEFILSTLQTFEQTVLREKAFKTGEPKLWACSATHNYGIIYYRGHSTPVVSQRQTTYEIGRMVADKTMPKGVANRFLREVKASTLRKKMIMVGYFPDIHEWQSF